MFGGSDSYYFFKGMLNGSVFFVVLKGNRTQVWFRAGWFGWVAVKGKKTIYGKPAIFWGVRIPVSLL